jgi:protein-tyrosine phosphatase
MDITWINERLALGGGIWNEEKMAVVAETGITHIIDMQVEFDDTELAAPYGICVLWNPVDDDFQPKPPEIFQRGVGFALQALEEPDTKLYIHCAAGVHRAPMMTLAVLRAMGWSLRDATRLLQAHRPAVDFAAVYVESVEKFIREYEPAVNLLPGSP